MTTRQQIDSFYQFASSQVDNIATELSMDQLYCLWRAKHPVPAELADSVASLNAAHSQMQSGDDGRPARAALREACKSLGLVLDP